VAVAGVRAAAGEAAPETLHLHSGARLTGRSVAVEQGQLRWELAAHQELLIPVEWIERLDIGGESATDSGPVPPLPDEALADPSLWIDPYAWFDRVEDWSLNALDSFQFWTRRLQIGGQFLDGNTQTDLLDVITEFEKGTPTNMRQVDVGGQWARNQNRQTANRWFMNSNFDWPVREGSQWITFVTSKNEYNALQNLDYRGTLSSGGGYRFYFEQKKRLIARFGPAFTVEVFHDPVTQRQTPDLFGEIELRWPLRQRMQFEEKFRVQPSMIDFELVRVFSTTGLVWDLDEKDRWKLRLGLQYNYNSEPNEGRVPSDYISTLSLVYLRK
jgi:putative salt-induced outer membrane protein YdiY